MIDTNSHKKFLEEKEKLINSLPVRGDIYLPTNKIPIDEQVKGLKRVKKIYEHDLENVYRPRLQSLKKGFKNSKRCFLIGNGPSLNNTDLSLLRDEVTFAANGFFLKTPELNWLPTFYVVEDHLVAEDRADQLNDIKGPIKLYPAYLGYCMSKADDTIFFNHRPRISYPKSFDFSTQADQITYTGCTVMFTMMQLAAYLGFDEIYLIGVDASYNIPKDVVKKKEYGTSILDMKTDDINHFHPDYFGKGYRWHDPQVDKMIAAYTEARKICEANNITIKNATVGGNLEVFERCKYDLLFENLECSFKEKDDFYKPKVIIIDFTRFGQKTATGEVKTKFFSSWDKSSIFHIYSESGTGFGITENIINKNQRYTDTEVLEKAKKFNADTILYRPVGNDPLLHELAIKLIIELKKPYSIWMMDDWPARQAVKKPSLKDQVQSDLECLCQSANACFAISESMAGAFGARYGSKFSIFHNGVWPELWDIGKLSNKKNKVLTVRYSGNLAKDMTLQSLLDIAAALQEISNRIEVKFEIRCQKHWFEEAKFFFKQYSVVSLDIANQSASDYREWLINADILVICNNFDTDSQRYIQYSFANKIPEYLASGQPVLAYGPINSSSINFLKKIDGVTTVILPDKSLLKEKLLELLSSNKKRKILGEKSKTYAFQKLNFAFIQRDFIAQMKKVSYSEYKGLNDLHLKKIKQQHTIIPKPSTLLIKEFKRYIFGLKGLLGITSLLLTTFGLLICTIFDILIIRLFGSLLVLIAQGILFLLIAHLAAHINVTNLRK